MQADDRIRRFLKHAVGLAVENVVSGRGGPFGAVVARGDDVIGEGANSVTAENDPTAHAEIVAIRMACRKLNSFRLEGCALYATCEPCPMCLAASFWARIDAIWYASDKEDAQRAGFADVTITHEVALPPEERILPCRKLALAGAREPFEKWLQSDKRIPY